MTPTWANFLFCRVGDEAGSLCQRLQGHGIIVRHMSGGWGAPDAFRLTVGTPEHNEQFLGALEAGDGLAFPPKRDEHAALANGTLRFG